MASEYMALLDKRGKLKEEGDSLLAAARNDGRNLTAEEDARLVEIETGMHTINAQIEREQRWREQTRSMPALPSDPEPETAAMPANPIPDPKAYRGPRPFATFGDQLKAIHAASTGRGFHPGLGEIQAAAQGAGEAIPSDGGYLVQQDFVSEIQRRMYQTGQLLSRVRRIPVSGNGLRLNAIDESSRAQGSRWGGVRAYWVDEGTAPTASRPTFRRIELALNKIAALGYASDELLEDATAASGLFVEAFADELTFEVEDAIFDGNGVGKPTGFAGSGNPSLIEITKETGQTADTVVAQNVIKARARLWARSRANSVWFINQDVEPSLHQMTLAVGTGGVPVYMPANGLADDGFDRLYGRPVVPIEYAPTVGDLGDIVLADLSQYLLIDKGGVQQASSMHVAFTTSEQAFRATYRVDGIPAWNAALTPANGSATVSPFVGIAARA